MTTVYGIPNCDRVRAARRWLRAHDVEHRFHDTRADGVPAARLRAWAEALGAEVLLNRRGRSWRELPAADRRDLDEAATLNLLAAHPLLLRRPLLEAAGGLLLGFDDAEYARFFGTGA